MDSEKMAAFVRAVLVLLIWWTQQCSAEDPVSRLNFNVTKISLTPNTISTGIPVSITCQPPTSGVASTLALKISRVPIDNDMATPTALAGAANDKNGGVAELRSALQGKGATVSGGVGSQYGDTVTLIMSRASCGDEGIYKCEGPIRTPTDDYPTSRSSKELKIEVSAGQVTATEPPPDKSVWAVNETMVMTCSGPVGSVNTTGDTNDPRISWVWQRSVPGRGWETLSTNDPNTDIRTGALSSRSCYKVQTSTLRQRLKTDDSGRQYRCYVQRNLQGFEDLGANYTVGTVTEGGITPGPKDPSGPAKANVGAIVGGIFGALILIAVIIIVIYFMVIRPRRQRKGAEYTDGGPEKGEEAVPPPYSEDPAVVYSQPVQRGKGKGKSEGVTNKAMDEADEKHPPTDHKHPPDNDDKRHGRRHRDKQNPSPYEVDPAPTPTPNPTDEYAKPHRQGRDHRRPRHEDAEEKQASRERSRRHDDDRQDHDNRRGRRHRDGDDYDERPRYDNGYDQGRRNRGYENEGRPRAHHSSSEDGGTDSFVNTSQYSMGDGDPTIGTAI